MFEHNGKQYELRYNIGRIETIERSLKNSLMNIMMSRDFTFSISELKTVLGFGMQIAGTDNYLTMKEGSDIAEELITTHGYAYSLELVTEALLRDCPFLFQNA